MRIFDGFVYRDMTEEEIKKLEEESKLNPPIEEEVEDGESE